MSETPEGFNKMQFAQFVGKGGQFVVRTNTSEELLAGMKEIVEQSGEFAGAVMAMQNAFGMTEAIANKNDSSEVTTTQKKTYGRTVKPGAAPTGGKVCEHGEPWNDCDGKSTKAGAKYKFRFYNSCKQDSCKPWGDPS